MKALLTSTRRRRKGSTLWSTAIVANTDTDTVADLYSADVDPKFAPLLPTDSAHPAFDKSRDSWTRSPKSEATSSTSFSSSSNRDIDFRDSFGYSCASPLSSSSSSSLRVGLGRRSPRTSAFTSTNNHTDSRCVDGVRVGSGGADAGLSTRHRHAPAWWILVAMMLYSSGIVGIPVVISSADDDVFQQQQQQQQRQPQQGQDRDDRNLAYDRDWEWRQWNEQRLRRRQNDFQYRKKGNDNVFEEMKNEILTEREPAPDSLSSSSSSSSKRNVVKVNDPSKKNFREAKSVNPLLRNSSSPVASRKLPQAIIIGVKKGGTRAFLEFLRFHPDVRAPGPEPHFFDKNYTKGLEYYRQLMPATLDGQLTIEKTPSYFVTRDVPEKIYDMSPTVKLIVVVRDPVNRAISDYTQSSSKRRGMKSFEELAFLNNVTGLIDTSWPAIKIGVYAKHLQRWLQFFPLSQFHFVDGENLIRNPGEEMIKVQDFLGLRRVISEKDFVFNSSKGFPCLKRPLHPQSPLKCLGKTKGRQHPHVDEYTLDRLRDFFRPFNNKFFNMIGQRFDWPSSRS